MKIKELQKVVNIAWSPLPQYPIYLAAGTAAQQFDSNANSTLEIYSTNFSDPSYELDLKASQNTKYKFHKLIWSPTGFGALNPNGLIVGGCEGGHIMVYSAEKLLSQEDGLVASQDKHSGPVSGLDFNPFQMNLLASCASESEIFIWDLNNTSTHMNPGTKTQPLEDVKNVAWNRQVQHILASVFSGRCVIWDLRKSEQIIKLSDTQSRVRWHAIQWHPDMATQVWLASEDDQAPVIQLWDLRYATAPAKTVQIHQRGVLGMSWCSRDTDLMVSCGKDNRIYCWNPNSQQPNSEILSEVATTASWYSDVQWCPRNPALIASSSFDGNVSIYSLFGGVQQQVQTSNKIADSFPGMDQFAQVPVNQGTAPIIYQDLKYAPKWLKPKAGVAFGFGGKLVSFNSNNKNVNVLQVITEPLLVERAQTLEKTLNDSMNFVDFCRQKADQMADQSGRYLWYFIKANFERNPKEEILNLLGYNAEDIDGKFAKYVNELNDAIQKPASNIEHITNRMSQLAHQPISENATLFDDIAVAAATATATATATNDTSASKRQLNDNDINGKSSLGQFKIPRGEDNVGLITEAIITGNIEAAVQLCLNTERIAEALILASSAGIDFLTKIQNHYLQQQQQQNDLSHIISALVTRDWLSFITQCDIESWKEALVAALRHNERKVSDICEKLGDRLLTERSQSIEYTRYAILCFVCAGNLDKLIMAWHQLKQLENHNAKHTLNTEELQELAEIIMLMNKSLEQQGVAIDLNNKTVEFITEYGCLLVAQGAFTAALTYLMEIKTSGVYPELDDLRERISNILHPQSDRIGMFQGQQQQQPSQLQTHTQPYQQTGIYSKLQQQQQQQQQQQHLYQGGSSFSHSTAIPTSNIHLGSNVNAYQTSSPNTTWNSNGAINASMVPPPLPTSHTNPMIPNNNNNTNNNYVFNNASNVQQQPPLPPQSLKQPIIENISEPSRPQSTTSSHDGIIDGNKIGTGLRARSKYVLDPSVAASNAINTMNPYGSVYNPTPAQMNPNRTPQYNTPTSFCHNNNNINNNYNNVMSTMGTSISTNPVNMMPTTSLSSTSIATSYSGTYLPGVAPIETTTSSSPPPAPFQNMQKNPTPPPGWNDPPSIQSTRQAKKLDAAQMYAAPITHPIFGVDPNQNQNGYTDANAAYINNQRNVSGMSHQTSASAPPPPPPTSSSSTPSSTTSAILKPPNDPMAAMNYQQSQQQQQQQQQHQQYNQQYLIQQREQQQQQQQQQHNYTEINDQYQQQQIQQHHQQQQQQQQQTNINRKANEAQQAIAAKPPLPEQYIYLQTVLEELKSHCLNKAADPRTKRKFVDVAKRLETLYDCLRDDRLTSATIQSLNQIVQFLQIGDYGNALQCHTQIAFGADFSQCAGFMPGLKVLIQSANELHVYL